MTTPFRLQRHLEENSGKKVFLKINDNSSTMLSVRWDSRCTRVSLHRMFLQAPRNIMEALACYIRNGKQAISLPIKTFIEENIRYFDYSHLIDPEKLSQQGAHYNLQKIYRQVNEEYFRGKLSLNITWFGEPNQRKRTRVIFGLYHDPLKLIKIHRLLDNRSVPEYVISYVIYHEMLHYVCPAYREGKRQRIHTPEFKELETKFRHYELAQKWIQENQNVFFKRF